METRSETWDSFWARTMRIDFFAEQWETYRKVADARAEWLEKTFKLDKGRPLLSCACGEGGIELALSRRGFNVTGIDRCPALISFARDQASKENLSATFLTADLRQEGMLPGGNGTVCCFDTLGLLSQEDEAALIKGMVAAMTPKGTLLVDSPRREGQAPIRTWWPVGEGHLLMETRFDRPSSTQVISPLFIQADGTRTVLADPYDATRGEHLGVQRYVYDQLELVALFTAAGLASEIVSHQRGGYFMVHGHAGLNEDVDEL